MKFNKILNYLMFIPFAIAIGAFALYFKYLIQVKVISTVVVTSLVNIAMNRYLKIGLFSTFIGLLFLFTNRISKLFFSESYYKEKYPWTNYKVETEENTKIENTIDDIEETITDNEDYIINMNSNVSDKISNDIKNEKILKARFIDQDEEKMIEILTDEDEVKEVISLDKVVIMPEVKKQTIIKIASSDINLKGFMHCPKCNNLISDEAILCVHCGESLKKEKINKINKPKFNPIIFAVNSIIVLIGIIAIIIMLNKISEQKTINESKVNSKTNINEIFKK